MQFSCPARSKQLLFHPQKALPWLWVFILALTVLGPYVRAPWSGVMLLNILVPINLVLAAVTYWVSRREQEWSRPQFWWLFVVWALWAVVGLAWAPSKSEAIRNLFYLCTRLSVIGFTAYYLRTAYRWRWIAYVGIGALALQLGVGLWEYLSKDHLPLSAALGYPFYLRQLPTGFMHNPNDYTFFLTMFLPLVTALPRWRRTPTSESIAVASFLFALWMATMANSRIGVLVLLLQGLWLMTVGLRRRYLSAAALAGMLVVMLPFVNAQVPRVLTYAVPKFVEDRLAKDRTTQAEPPPKAGPATPPPKAGPATPPALPTPGSLTAPRTVPKDLNTLERLAVVQAGLRNEFTQSDQSGGSRLHLMRLGMQIFVQSKGLGVGAGNSSVVARKLNPTGLTNMHNWWVELLVDFGIPGFALFLAFYIGLLWRLWKRWRHSPDGEIRYITEAALVALLSFSLSSIAPSSIAGMAFPWVLFGLGLLAVAAEPPGTVSDAEAAA